MKISYHHRFQHFFFFLQKLFLALFFVFLFFFLFFSTNQMKVETKIKFSERCKLMKDRSYCFIANNNRKLIDIRVIEISNKADRKIACKVNKIRFALFKNLPETVIAKEEDICVCRYYYCLSKLLFVLESIHSLRINTR